MWNLECYNVFKIPISFIIYFHIWFIFQMYRTICSLTWFSITPTPLNVPTIWFTMQPFTFFFFQLSIHASPCAFVECSISSQQYVWFKDTLKKTQKIQSQGHVAPMVMMMVGQCWWVLNFTIYYTKSPIT